MDITIRLAEKDDFPAYLHLMQKTYQASFVNEKLGLTKERFSEEIFNSPTSREFSQHMMEVTNTQKCWLAFDKDTLIGSITMKDEGRECVVGGFYVATDYQGMGIGKRLWDLAEEYAKGKDITLSVYTHNTKAIALYKKWGFVEDPTKDIQIGHWPDWPEGVTIKILYMRRKGEN